jgi:hypothetical protein
MERHNINDKINYKDNGKCSDVEGFISKSWKK